MSVEHLKTDILILGSGGAGLFAALHALKANPDLDITVASKGLLGKCGCTRMVQGGYNVALNLGDSIERHFMDTIEGGKWLPHQELAWTLVSTAVERVRELENEIGCFFDRNPDGTLHGKAFAGQTFDRTVHKGDLTGIEIINRLMEQVWARPIRRLEEHRAVALIPATDGSLAGVLMIDVRAGEFRFVSAQTVLLATGGGPTMYRYHTPSGDKTAHYFMGGVICEVDTATECAGLFVAGEDASGMHGANRLGGNGVANSTVFGGIAGDVMPRWIGKNPGHRPAETGLIEAEIDRALHPFTRKPGDLNALREKLLDTMWDDVGVVRDRAGIERGLAGIERIEAELLSIGVADADRRFNLTWHDWLNLRSLCEVCRVTELGDIELNVPRTRRYSPVGVVRGPTLLAQLEGDDERWSAQLHAAPRLARLGSRSRA
jgi:succinate dehydrogenase/fumarate reductase flavoprotein subunit